MGKTYGGMWKPARQQAGKLKEETAKDAFKKGERRNGEIRARTGGTPVNGPQNLA